MSTPPTGRERIILDCDPGIDDALAILLALSAPERIELLALTTVAGNVPLEATTRNAGRVLTLAGHPEVPVHAGCARAIMGPIERGAEIHGADGLGNVALPEPQFPPEAGHAVDVLTRTILEEPSGSLTLCVTGPMTNIALALIKEPAIAARLKALVFMGGAVFVPGNMGEAGVAEFNFFTDPQAAEIVLSADIPKVVMMGLDVTRQALVTPERLDRLAAIGGASARAAAAMLGAYGRETKYLHDPTVIAYLLAPELFGGKEASVTVDCGPGPMFGHSLAEVPPDPKCTRSRVTVMTELDAEGFFELLTQGLAKLP
jgi:purine nucleosidase